MDGHDPGVIVDGVDDPVVASPSRDEAGKLANERLAELVGIFADRAGKSDEGGVANLCRQPVQMGETLRGYTDFVHPD